MLLTVIVLAAVILAIHLFTKTKPFGAVPSGERLKKILRSPHYSKGQFQNLSHTPSLTEGASFFGVLREFLFDQPGNKIPPAPLPSVRTDLLQLPPEKNCLVWFGHSSYFLQLGAKTFLVDPVFSGNASPLFFTTRSFKGSDIYTPADFPPIDFLIITHDHWDHLDYKTILELKPKVRNIITSLGVGAHLVRWGYDESRIREMDWNQEIQMEEGVILHSVPARHFSGRGFKRNGTLWSSFVLAAAGKKIFIGGDSGYDSHFKEAGEKFGPFDLVILEDGQYNRSWKYIHMSPEETVQAAIELGAKKLLPVHWAKFSLSLHAWDEPIIRITKEASRRNVNCIHPLIGENVDLDKDQVFVSWWEGIH